MSTRIDPKTIDKLGDFIEFDQKVRQAIPMGMKVHSKPIFNIERAFPYDELTEYATKFIMAYNKKFKTEYPLVKYDYEQFKNMCERVGIDQWYAQRSLGTLGGGR